ncbi:MAG TPA: nucleotide exchange factor GrpE [Anaerolineales bacterium]|jgi:molecular chaperone GrpE
MNEDKNKPTQSTDSMDPEVVEAEIVREEKLAEETELEELNELGDEVREDITELKKELEAIRLKSDEYLEGWQRARAEFANFRKRIDREREQSHQTAAGTIIRRYLEILDDLERALSNRPPEGEGAIWAGGIELIYRKFLKTLESEGVKRMEAEGEMFDPNMHEAISHEESPDHESGQIIEVVQPGYMLGDRVLRPALVRVAK